LIRLDLKEMPEEEDYEVAARRRTARRRWSSPLRAPPRRDLGTRDTTWQISNIEKVGGRGEPILAFHYQQRTPARHFMILAF
jgi:hypothetical protein